MKLKQKNSILVSLFFILICLISFSSAQSLKKQSGDIFQQATVKIDEKQNAPVEVRFKEDQQVSVTTFFEGYRQAFAWSENNKAIQIKELRDNLGQTHYRIKQHYKGIELAEVQYLLHEKEGSVTYAHGKLIHGLDLDVTPVLSEEEALRRALDHIGAESYMWENKKNEAFFIKEQNDRDASYFPHGEVKISAGLEEHVTENFRLVYRFDIFAEKPLSRNYVDVDAKTGEIVGVIPRMYSDDVQGRGTTLYNGDVDIVVSDSNYYGPDDPLAHFHVDDWNAYEGVGTSWWVADTTFGDQGGYGDAWYETLDTDPISLNGENLILKFNHRYSVEPPSPLDNYDGWDGMNVRISIDGGDTWQVLQNPTPNYSNESLFSFGEIHGEGEGIPGWAGELNEWTEVTFDLSSYAGQTVQVRFAFASDEFVSTEDGEPDWFGWQLDDIIVSSIAETLYTNNGIEDELTATNFIKEAIIVDGNYRLRESGRGGGIATFDAGGTFVLWRSTDFVDNDSIFTDPNDQAGVSTHWAAEATYDYFLDKHGRNSYDDAGGRIISYVHYGEDFLNAQWTGSHMQFGDGNELNDYRPLVNIDVIAHEFTHGVTQYTASLIYQDQYGALNESFSDIFGEHVENYLLDGVNDWLMGDEVGTIRSFINPNTYGQPDTYLGSMWYTGTADYGGVHINSGVQNFWFYLLSVGGTGVNDHGDEYSVTAIGMEEAAQIAYRNLTVYLMPTSEYEDARGGSLNAAVDLFGVNSPQFNSVQDAWNAVGVYYPFIGPYPELTTINGSYFVPGNDTLVVISRISNPKNHDLEVVSIVQGFDHTVNDTIPMFDDGMHQDSSSGDGHWGGSWPIPSSEQSYTVHTKSVSLDSGFQNILKDAAFFTTKGPIVLESFMITSEDSIVNPGDRLSFNITLKNNGLTVTASDITATMESLDTCATVFSRERSFGDISPGESNEGERPYSIQFSNTCGDSIWVSFKMSIFSDEFLFWSDTFSVFIYKDPTGLTESYITIPIEFALQQNYPNPFNPSTMINYQLPMISDVELSIYNLLGQKIKTLVSERQEAGSHQVEWDASGFSSGVYYYKINAGEYQAVRKMILVR
jgi:Zn-dependent metalloprotease